MIRYYRKINLPALNTQWLTNLPPSMVSAIIITVTSTAAISMVFKGDLSVYLPIGISCALIGAIVVNAVSKFVCVFPFAISCMTPNSAVVMGLFLTDLSKLNLPQQDFFYTIFAAFLITSFITALFLSLVGALKLGKLIRFMPYPVMCGFFAGVGWYLFIGAFHITGIEIEALTLNSDFHDVLLQIGPALAFSLVVFMAQRKYKNPFTYISLITVSMALFYAWLMYKGIDHQQASVQNLTIESHETDFLFKHFGPHMFSYIHWGEIFSRWTYIFAFAVVNLLSLLAYAVNFEEISHTTADLDRETKFIGLSNIMGTFLSGGTSIFTTQSLAHRETGANHSISVLYVSIFCIFILFFSNYIIPFIPKFIVSGILITNGFSLIHKWLFKMARKISLEEWSIIAIIFLIMIYEGFIQGISVGLALAFMLFIFTNSQAQFIRYEIPGNKRISNAFYPIERAKVLQESGGKIRIIKIQGFFFFGTAERLYTHVINNVLTIHDPKIAYLILDFSLVTDVDSTAVHTLLKLQSVMALQNCTLILTNLNKRSRKHMGMAASSYKTLEFLPYFKSMILNTKRGNFYAFEDIDAGLEWAEKKILQDFQEPQQQKIEGHLLEFSDFLDTAEESDIFRSYLKKIKLKKGEHLVTPEHPDMSMYFIEEGHVAYLLLKENRLGYKRMSEFGPGHVIGELQFYLGRELENMKIDCIEDCVLYKLNKVNYKRLEQDYPNIALKFSTWIIKIISRRLDALTEEIKMLL